MADPQIQQLIDEQKKTNSLLGSSNFSKSSNPISTSASTSGGGIDLGAGKSIISSAIDAARNGINATTETIPRILEPWQQASKIGIGFNNDAIGFRTGVAQTRMSVQDWGDAISKTQLGLTAFGGSMSNGARVFTDFSRDFSNTNAADALQSMGYTTEEYNQVLALSIVGKKRSDLEDRTSREQAMQSAVDLATEMDKVAKLTGVSRKEQQDALDASMHNARTRIAIDRAVAAGGEENSAAYKKLNSQMEGLGLKDFADNLYAGNAKTKETIEMQNALGPAGTQLEVAIKATREAKTAEQREAANSALQSAQAAVAARMQSEEYKNLAQYGLGPVADAAGKAYISTLNYSESIKAVQEEEKKKGNIITETQAAQLAADRAKLERQGKDIKGENVEGAKTTQVLTQSLRSINDQQAGFAQELGRFNNWVGAQKLTKEAIDFTKNVKTDEKTGKQTAMMERSIATEVGNAIRDLYKNPSAFIETAKVKTGEFIADTFKVGKEGSNWLAEQFNMPKPFAEEKPKVEEKEGKNSFASGTKDVFGDWFGGNFGEGELSKLHGTEAVIPKDKINEFMNDMGAGMQDMAPKPEMFSSVIYDMTSQIEDMANTLQSNTKNSQKMPTISSDIFSGVKQQLTTALKPEPVITPPIPKQVDEKPTEQPTIKTKATLDDIQEELINLNKSMVHLISNSDESINLTSKQVRATKQLSPNMNIR